MGEAAQAGRPAFAYDFTRPGKLTKDKLRTVQMMHEAFGQLVQGVLENVLRMSVRVGVTEVRETSFHEVTNAIASPTVLGVVRIEPLEGHLLIEIDADLAFAIVDRLLGGPGVPVASKRPMTDIELQLVRRVVGDVLAALERSWSPVQRISAVLERLETNPSFVRAFSPNETVVVIRVPLHVKGVQGQMALYLPYGTLQPLLSRLKPEIWLAAADDNEESHDAQTLRTHLNRLELAVHVELGSVDVSLGEVLSLQVGDVVRLKTKTTDPLPVLIEGRCKFLGVAGRVGDHMAVQIVEVTGEDDGR